MPWGSTKLVLGFVFSHGLSWMVKLYWTAIRCCRKASFAMCSHKSVQLRGSALLERSSRSLLCCLAVKWLMNGLTSCCRKGTFGPPSPPKGLPLKRSLKPFERNGIDCMLSIFGWRSSLAGMCCPTGCIRMHQLGCPASDSMNCSSTGLPKAAKRIPMKRRHTVDQISQESRRDGSNAKIGCGITKVKPRHGFWIFKVFFMLSGTKKSVRVRRLIPLGLIVQKGGKQEMVRTCSSDGEFCLT